MKYSCRDHSTTCKLPNDGELAYCYKTRPDLLDLFFGGFDPRLDETSTLMRNAGTLSSALGSLLDVGQSFEESVPKKYALFVTTHGERRKGGGTGIFTVKETGELLSFTESFGRVLVAKYIEDANGVKMISSEEASECDYRDTIPYPRVEVVSRPNRSEMRKVANCLGKFLSKLDGEDTIQIKFK